ncbi:4Fe-4S binding protein [Neptuniibacter sp. 1_MG-2023]|uniref:4Fe-4S binding protein n=1 Tax=Neptuniibacter sp. 1_MG-2023 TaxID=3062662 RepID=UPI0026E3D16C|nr:4Fe-4S binding protein [Neptuniibacter sp. 1_MG-2023]MDO6594060.1 4Fe-4S binding protein [Neptuniibacter sp. 1_MG-2023]
MNYITAVLFSLLERLRIPLSLLKTLIAILSFTFLLVCNLAQAGVMDKAAMEKAFPSPYVVGDKDEALPIWPLYQQISTDTPLVGYAFESIDLAAIPGFAGIPFNLLVAIDPDGRFIDVRVLSHHEPVFLEGLGEKPLIDFSKQYKGVSLMQNIKIDAKPGLGGANNSANVYIDGVTKATASVRIFNQSLLASSLKVAREKLGYAKGRDPDLIARIKPDLFESMSWQELLDEGLIVKYTFSNKEVEARFEGTIGEGQDPEALEAPDEQFVEIYAANLTIPSVGRNLLLPTAWDYVKGNIAANDQLLLILSQGRYSFTGEDFVRGKVPERISLHQAELPIEMRDFDLDDRLNLFDLEYKLNLPEELEGFEWKLFHVIGQAGLDPAYPAEFKLNVVRQKGWLYPESVTEGLDFKLPIPEQYILAAESDNKTWHSLWAGRTVDIAILIIGLVILTVVLVKHRILTGPKHRLRWFRPLYLLFTLVFIGWYAQGQLSIVNITGVLQALVAGRSLEFFLYDPMTVLLWAYIGITFFVWGRGTFCGWLCPFGALQELIGKLLAFLKLPQIKVSPLLDSRLKWIKYVVLAGILIVAVVSIPLTGSVVEIEPFKTSITLIFDRSWPFVLWAVVLLALSLFVYKGYCRYICPLGAGLAIFGKLRIFNWLPRRSECGQPCQLCKHRCEYQSIEQTGKIDYDECFQCLDCVEIYESDELCVPLIVEKRKGRKLKTRQDNDNIIASS